MKGADWSDLSHFAVVAHAGGLTPAAAATGLSVATLSRRMTALEKRVGKRLFLHGRQGYAVTAEGRELLSRITRMEAAAVDIGRWASDRTGPVRVRISAGFWTSLKLAQDLPAFWSPACAWVAEFVSCNVDMDIARREIDIGVRNRRPEQPWLAGRRTGTVSYGVYARTAEVTGWIGAPREPAPVPSARWIEANHAGDIVTTANDPRIAFAMAGAGIGRVVLPTFFGDTTGLVRIGAPIADLEHDEWLVSHHETRHDPPIREALDALARHLSSRGRVAAA